ncbi:hypothetical protein J6590_019003 [Homalodisca vitripennis]|nr:hypothetical protein J6590_019003 [Homalodisca vitripennis]
MAAGVVPEAVQAGDRSHSHVIPPPLFDCGGVDCASMRHPPPAPRNPNLTYIIHHGTIVRPSTVYLVHTHPPAHFLVSRVLYL